MPKRIPSSEFISAITTHGFQFVSKRGSHANYRNANGCTVIIPHPRKDIPVGTLRSMIRQRGLPKELFD